MKLIENIEVSPLRIIKNKELDIEVENIEKTRGDDIEVNYINGVYQIKSNQKEFEQFVKNNSKKIPVKIITDLNKVLNHLIYRTKKEKLNPVEIAFLFEEIKAITKSNQKELAILIEKTQGNISNKTRLLKLPLFLQIPLIKNELTERHGRAFLQLEQIPESQKEMQKVYKEVIQKKLNVAQTELIIDKILNKEKVEPSNKIEKIKEKRELKNKNVIPSINQINSDLEKTLELINKYNPEIKIIQEEGIQNKDYVITIKIKDVN